MLFSVPSLHDLILLCLPLTAVQPVTGHGGSWRPGAPVLLATQSSWEEVARAMLCC